MSGGGVRQWTRQSKKGCTEGREEERKGVIKRAMGYKRVAVVTNYCRTRGRKGMGQW